MTRPAEWLSAVAVLLVVAASACANTFDMSIGADCATGFCEDQLGFTSPDGGADATGPERVLACIGTMCPPPYATCGDVPSALCTTNLSNDSKNCGACGISCGGIELERLRLRSRCSNGACELECIFDPGSDSLFRDCNDTVDDGCEVDIFKDPENCGACGHACAPGTRCEKGACGCPLGKLDCNGECIDPQWSDDHCKTCGNACTAPDDGCTEMPPNTRYGCVEGACGGLKCKSMFGDCDGDVPQLECSSNGCEASLLDPNHCGACGVKCGPQQECALNALREPGCRDVCSYLGLVRCGDLCVDLATDPGHCGACGVQCATNHRNELGVCQGGVCKTECVPGFGDCNEDVADGCETDLRTNPANCGACGAACDQRAGQPCIDGKCLMVECDGGVEAR